MFKNREDAGKQLAEKLKKYSGKDGVVFSVPRGGVPVGFEIANSLGWPLDLVLSKKIGHPTNKEFAIGAASLNGWVHNKDLNIDHNYLQTEVARIRTELKNTYHKYLADKLPIIATDKTVVLVDDGIATGHTLLSTIDLIEKDNPHEIVVAVPVSSPDALRRIQERVNEVICLESPEDFRSVGQAYQDFEQVTDEEVMDKLHGRRYQNTDTPKTSDRAARLRESESGTTDFKQKDRQVNSRDLKS